MSLSSFSFGEWLPDLPDLGNPGITEALNVLPVDAGYTPYLPHLPIGSTLIANANAVNGYIGRSGTTELPYIFANGTTGATGQIYFYDAGTATFSAVSSTLSSSIVFEFTQFDDMVIGTSIGTGPYVHTLGAVTGFTALSATATAPPSNHVGVVNRFVILGQGINAATSSNRAIQWSAIDDPRNWPVPNTATATATQAGSQFFDGNFGIVTGISSGDQHGIIFQQYATHRITYNGPPTVFQFDRIDAEHGAYFEYGTIQIGGLTYFVSRHGFCVTDGVTVKNISDKKVFRAFQNSLGNVNLWVFPFLMRVGADLSQSLIFWAYPSTVPGGLSSPLPLMDKLIIYNYKEDRWTHATDSLQIIFGASSLLGSASTLARMPYGISATGRIGTFNGTAGTAILTSAEVEPNTGGCAYIEGVKPIIGSTGSLPTIGVQVGSRNDQGTIVSYSATTVPTSRTGFADFRANDRFHRARVYIAGSFDKAQGVEIEATPAGRL